MKIEEKNRNIGFRRSTVDMIIDPFSREGKNLGPNLTPG